MIRWFTENGIAANFLMLGILVAGALTAVNHVPLEVTPALSWDTVMITMTYRGATAKDVERAILIPIEESLEGVEGIRHLHADGMRGLAKFYLNAEPGVDLRELMDEGRHASTRSRLFRLKRNRPGSLFLSPPTTVRF